ncbi:dipeptidase [Sphingobium phenoxybenzoativorans]|uniref:Dipeptidase n=1 Tax=Sphingobium phenoxybenzoativorans TaxID=1592790 RepID=A0A975K7J0_9SPHN|nr:dipeptidase [Sphingobium phenoxybenzoativorans]
MHRFLTTAAAILLPLPVLLPLPAMAAAAPAPADPYMARVAKVLAATPLIDGHNDWPEALVDHAGDKRWTLDLNRLDTKDYDTDIERLRLGKVGGQFWSVFVSPALPGLEQVKATLEQIDLVNQIVRRYPQTFQLAMTAADVRAAHKAGKIASMIGVEGGGQIDKSLSVLRAYKRLGAGYLTLTHAVTIDWADSATDNPKHEGLTKFGETVVHELNRLGMLVDLSHVSEATMLDALAVTKAPVIFSHSSAKAICDHSRNVSDAVLKQVAANGGVVMVNFAPNYISEKRRVWGAARGAEQARYNAPPFGGLYIGDPEKAKAALAQWEKANPEPKVTMSDVADHIDHIAKVAGADHVGLGGDYDGLPALPEGMDGVETYPKLLAELMRRGWSDADIAKLAGGNILRVMEAAEKVAASMRGEPAATETIAQLDSTK